MPFLSSSQCWRYSISNSEHSCQPEKSPVLYHFFLFTNKLFKRWVKCAAVSSCDRWFYFGTCLRLTTVEKRLVEQKLKQVWPVCLLVLIFVSSYIFVFFLCILVILSLIVCTSATCCLEKTHLLLLPIALACQVIQSPPSVCLCICVFSIFWTE